MAWAAGLIVAVHPTLVYAATHVQAATLSTTLLIWTLAWSYQTGLSRRTADAAVTGAIRVLALTDPILALAAAGIAWAIGQRWPATSSHWRQSLKLIAVVGIVATAGISPWLVRNWKIHGELVAIKSTFGYAFWQGNCHLSQGTDKVVRHRSSGFWLTIKMARASLV